MFYQRIFIVRKSTWCVLLLLYKLSSMSATLLRRKMDLNVFDFDVNDIFDEKLMPVQIFSQQLQTFLDKGNNMNVSAVLNSWQSQEIISINNTDLNAALSAMRYHRRMMNEFMATDYLAEQILNMEAKNVDYNKDEKILFIDKRVGTAQNVSEYSESVTNQKSEQRNNKYSKNHKLVDDEGMTRYKSFLEKTTTLEDIHRQLEGSNAHKMKGNINKPGYNRRQAFELESALDDDDQGFEDGDITGYATTTNAYDYTQNTANHQHWPIESASSDIQVKWPYVQAINKNGYESGYEDYGVHSPPPQSHTHPQPHPPSPPSRQIKEIGLKDITDIALTTLAFLSFGMFILQVLMCITMGKEDTSNMMMLPMETTDPSEIPGDGTEEIRRKRRSVPEKNSRLIMMNELARRVLFSIDAVLYSPKDDASCHFWSLCENNRFAKYQANGQKFWIPIWSLGMSWLTTRVLKANTTTTSGEYVPVMQSLKAVVIGMIGKDNCETYFTNTCNQHKK